MMITKKQIFMTITVIVVLIFELGNRKLVAGQEDLILEVAQKLKK